MSTATETRAEEQAALKADGSTELRQRIKIRTATEGMTMREYVSAMLERVMNCSVFESELRCYAWYCPKCSGDSM